MEKKYLELLSKSYPDISSATTEIINLQATLNLPKGTEHFITDLHGENEQFHHVLRNCSGAIKRNIEEEFSYELSQWEKKELAMLIYYPDYKLKQDRDKRSLKERVDWQRLTIYRLVILSKKVSSKYTRAKVRKAMPETFAYIMEELITGHPQDLNQNAYYDSIVTEVIRVKRADELIMALCNLIHRLTVDHLHVIGDIYDRGPYPHIIMDTLIDHHSVDVQWGNHDILWMGAAAGSGACIANAIRISAKYGNLHILEEGYGINLVPLVAFAMDTYHEDSCSGFKLDLGNAKYKEQNIPLTEKVHKAITIIQFKLEGQLIKENPEFDMADRNLLHLMKVDKGQIIIKGENYHLLDTNFPTIDPKDPYTLTAEEKIVVDQLKNAFIQCEKLQRHTRFLYKNGSLYKKYNGNLLFHGCVPLNEDGSFKKVTIFGQEYQGQALYHVLEDYAIKGYYADDPEEKKRGLAILWFIWTNKNSPVFGKDKMATFERYLVKEEKVKVERKNPYYDFLESEPVINSILHEFGLGEDVGHIVNGHVPVQVKKGESPVKCKGKLLMIDGGFSKEYQGITGIAGYTLVSNSYGLILAAHEPFESMEKAILEGKDIRSQTILVEQVARRQMVKHTDVGKKLKDEISNLEDLVQAYRSGRIVEK